MKLEMKEVMIASVIAGDMESGRNSVRACVLKSGVKIEAVGDTCGGGRGV